MRSPFILLLALAWMLVALESRGQRLLAYYPLDGQATMDLSGNRNNGVWHGGLSPTTDRYGRPCSALHFNGQDGYVEIPSSPSLNTPSQQFTATAWCRLDPLTPDAPRWVTLLCKGDGASETLANPHYRVQVLQAPAIQQSTVSINSDFTEYDPTFSVHPFPVGSWFFYALTYDGATVRTFQNGVEVFAFDYQGSLNANDFPLFIGRDAPGAMEFFKGSLDELRLYDGALTSSQLLQLFKAPAPQQGAADFTLECPARRVVDAASGQCSAVVTFALPTASTPCGTVTVKQTLGLPSGSAFPVGSTTLAFQAVSADGAKKTCYTSIKVVDREPPQISCLPDTVITAKSASPAGAVWRYALPVATDNCPNVRVELAQGGKSGTLFPFGVSELVFAAIDQQGNRTECRRRVIVQAAPVPPVLVAQVSAAVPLVPAKPLVGSSPPAPAIVGGRVIRQDSVKPGATLQFRTCTVTILAYDGYDEDGDSISVFFQGREIVAKQMIVNKGHGVIIRPLQLNAGEKNSLIVKAWNVGRPGTPNTLKVEFFDGYYTEDTAKQLQRKKPAYTKVLYSLPGLSDSINLTCKQK
ncbi:LamG-like jellyroll fold domain-containing protein [Hymenobacter terricola]|uniref:LamG-like jellyroll fold domain-containing protein n=1 Tax=Hymenobacter terricola TaxID=2819236 RepID=UPI001CF479D8|nr:LamG-like jellyroll fold domain-containing protein [Hymenobacter terricola]